MSSDLAYPSSPANISLSTYFPKNTRYFYGYPSGDYSGFVNYVPPETEELVAMRANSCAGPNISVINYPATNSPQIDKKLFDLFNIPYLSHKQLALLPNEISPHLTGNKRNEAVKAALNELAIDGNLVMAQPYLSQRLKPKYQISANIIMWLNDKQNLENLLPDRLIPKRLASYNNGKDFTAALDVLPVPVVIKMGASSSGDGVFICKTKSELINAARTLKHFDKTILAEQYVQVVKNFGLHLGIPSDTEQPIDFIGINEQLTTSAGNFVGGIIHSRKFPVELLGVKHYLEYVALPKVRQMGWYGVGCLDVLLGDDGRPYVIDCNFRMTGMSAYHFMVANGELEPPLVGFSGEFYGSQAQLEEALIPYAGQHSTTKFMQLIALSHHDGTWRFNAALMFNTAKQLKQRSKLLLQAGITSESLRQLS